MARVTVEDCLERVSNRFALVALVTKRVKQLLKGDPCLIREKNKPVVNALREVSAGKIRFDCGTLPAEQQLEADLRVEKTHPSHFLS